MLLFFFCSFVWWYFKVLVPQPEEEEPLRVCSRLSAGPRFRFQLLLTDIVGLPEEAPFSEARARFPHDISISLAHQYICCTTSGFPRLVPVQRQLPGSCRRWWTHEMLRHLKALRSCIRSPLVSSPTPAVCCVTAPRRGGVQPTGNAGAGAAGSAPPAPGRRDVRWCEDVKP